jgi:hypothetical protein
MASSDMYILVVGLIEDLMDEAKNEVAEELGYDSATEDENEQQEIYAKAIPVAIERHIRGELVYYFYKHTCEPEGEPPIAEMDIYVKAGEKFIPIDNLYNASAEDLINIDHECIGLYFIFDKEIEVDEEYFLTLSGECSDQCDRITYLHNNGDKFVYQGYADGDYDTGYFTNDEEEYYLSTSDEFPFSNFIAHKEQVLGQE